MRSNEKLRTDKPLYARVSQPLCDCHPDRVIRRDVMVRPDGLIFVNVLLTTEEWNLLENRKWPGSLSWPDEFVHVGPDPDLSAAGDAFLSLRILEVVFPEKRRFWDRCRVQAALLKAIGAEDVECRVIH